MCMFLSTCADNLDGGFWAPCVYSYFSIKANLHGKSKQINKKNNPPPPSSPPPPQKKKEKEKEKEKEKKERKKRKK